MPASDILNPRRGWDQNLGDSMNPSFGFNVGRDSTLLRTKSLGGAPESRETQNTGRVFSLSWLNRTLAVKLKLEWYAEQYEDGFFTFVDWDGAVGPQGRQYVVTIVSPVKPTLTANQRWDIQNVLLEEVPTVAMEKYPSDWENQSVRRYAFDDYNDQKLHTWSSQQTGWAANNRQIRGAAVKTMDNPAAAANAGDWCCYEYRGYGFKLYLMGGPEFGQCTVQLDGNAVGGAIDCYAAADVGAKMVLCEQNVPLDIHRVKVIVSGAKNANATAATISWHSLEVMR